MSVYISEGIGESVERSAGVLALRAAELRLALRFEARTRERLEADLRRVGARLSEREPRSRAGWPWRAGSQRLVGPD